MGGENSQDIILRSDSCLTWWSQNGKKIGWAPACSNYFKVQRQHRSSFLDTSTTTTKNWSSPWIRLQSQCHQAFQKWIQSRNVKVIRGLAPCLWMPVIPWTHNPSGNFSSLKPWCSKIFWEQTPGWLQYFLVSIKSVQFFGIEPNGCPTDYISAGSQSDRFMRDSGMVETTGNKNDDPTNKTKKKIF